MASRLDGPDAKVERAYQHIAELEREIGTFFQRQPYEVIPDEGTEPGRRLYRIRVRESPPLLMAVILGDIFHNLRSGFDLLAWQCVEAGGGKPGDRTGFPISETAKGFEAALRTKVKGASKQALDLMRSTKPYKEGNDLLWQLHHLNRFDKHRLLPVVGAAFQTLSLDFSKSMEKTWAAVSDKPLPPMRIGLKSADRMFPLKDGDVLFSDDGKQDFEPQFQLYVAFGQSGYAEGEPILDTVRQIAEVVNGILNGFRPILV